MPRAKTAKAAKDSCPPHKMMFHRMDGFRIIMRCTKCHLETGGGRNSPRGKRGPKSDRDK